MNDFDIKRLVIDKVCSIHWYVIKCPVCGYRTPSEEFTRFCPVCGKDLKIGEGHEVASDEKSKSFKR